MGCITDFKNGVNNLLAVRMDFVGERICASMRSNLQAAGHVDTGKLLNSIHQETTTTQDAVVTRIYADARGLPTPKNPKGAMYGEFIELGSGKYRAGGSQVPWHYRDRFGNWHTTEGMKADPWIMPAVNEHIGDIEDEIIYVVDRIAKYGKEVV